MKEKCKSLFETNGIFYYLLKNGNTQGEICKILNITRRKILKGISKFFPDSSFQNFAQIKNMGLSFNENKIIESKSLKLFLFCCSNQNLVLSHNSCKFNVLFKKSLTF